MSVEPTITKADVLSMLEECEGREPSGADVVEWLCGPGQLNVSDAEWNGALEPDPIMGDAGVMDLDDFADAATDWANS